MPTVPVYDRFQAGPTTLPRVATDLPATPDVAGQQAQQLGQSLQRAGGELGRIALDATQQANRVRVNDAMNQAVSARNYLTYHAPTDTDQTAGFVHLRGEAALKRPDDRSLDQEYTDRLQKDLAGIEAGLGNEAQRAEFRQQSGALVAQFQGALTQHAAKEYVSYQGSVQDGTIRVASDQMALAWGNAALLDQSAKAIKSAVVEKGRLDGLSAQQVEANLVEALSPGHAAVIASAVDAGKLDYAREYLKQVNAELTPAARLQMTKVLDEGDFEARTQDGADTLYAKHQGDAASALAEARATLSGKEEDAVVARLKTYDAERVALRERGQTEAADRSWKLVAQGQSVPPSLFAAMDGRDAMAVRRVLNEGTPVKTDVGKWLDFTNLKPDAMAAMTPQQLMREYRPYFSDSDLRNADQMIQAAKGLRAGQANAEGLQLMTTNELLKGTAIELGILPETGSPKKEQIARYQAFAANVQLQINEWQATNGKKASADVLRDLLDKEKLNIVRYDEWWTDTDHPYASLTPEQQKISYVPVGDEEVRLSAIPDDYRADATRRIKAKGLRATEGMIAAMWAADHPRQQ